MPFTLGELAQEAWTGQPDPGRRLLILARLREELPALARGALTDVEVVRWVRCHRVLEAHQARGWGGGSDYESYLGTLQSVLTVSPTPLPVEVFLLAEELQRSPGTPGQQSAQARLELAVAEHNPACIHLPWALLESAQGKRHGAAAGEAAQALRLAEQFLDEGGMPPLEARACRARLDREWASYRLFLGQNSRAAARAASALAASRALDLELAGMGIEDTYLERLHNAAGPAALTQLAVLSAIGRHDLVLERSESLPLHDPGAVLAAQLHYYRGVAWRAQGRLPTALKSLTAALDGSVLDPIMEDLARLERIEALLSAGQLEPARAAISAMREQQAGLEIGARALHGARLAAAELKARLLRTADLGQLRTGVAELEVAYAQLLEIWGRERPAEASIGFLSYAPRREVLSTLIHGTLASSGPRLGPERALHWVLQAQALGSLGSALGAPAGSYAEIKAELLQPGELVLVFLPSANQSHLFLIDAAGVEHRLGPSLDDLRPALRALRRALRDPSSAPAEVASAAQTLGTQWLAPATLERMAGATCITLVGGELLNGAPLELIPLPSGQALGLGKAVSRLPSLPVGLFLARRNQEKIESRSLAASVAPAIGSEDRERYSLGPVLFPKESRDRILAAWSKLGQVEWRSAEQATLVALQNAQAATLLIFTHAVMDSHRARPGALVLAPTAGSQTSLAFAEHLRKGIGPQADLVLLAACSAGRSVARLGDDDSDQLGAAFLAAGARAVVLSPEPLHQEATAILVENLLRAIAESPRSPAEALRQARLALSADARFQHPHYWASMIVQGLGHRPGLGRP